MSKLGESKNFNGGSNTSWTAGPTAMGVQILCDRSGDRSAATVIAVSEVTIIVAVNVKVIVIYGAPTTSV